MDSMTFEEAVKNYEELKKRFEDFKRAYAHPKILGIFKRKIPEPDFEKLEKMEHEAYEIHTSAFTLQHESKNDIYKGSFWHDTYDLHMDMDALERQFKNKDEKTRDFFRQYFSHLSEQ